MRRILFAIILALLPVLALPMISRKAKDPEADYVPINRVISYFSDISDTKAVSGLSNTLTNLNDIVSDGYNFGDALKVIGYLNLASIQFMLTPFSIISKFIGFIPYYVDA